MRRFLSLWLAALAISIFSLAAETPRRVLFIGNSYTGVSQLPEAVVPAGDAWELNYRNPDAPRLHAPDHSHPLFAGTYLGALVFYQTIYHARDSRVTWHGNLTAGQAEYLQGIAARTAR